MKSDDKNLWRERWLGCINELTTLDLQMKSWIDKTQTNPHWSFIEFTCSYFDDLAIDENYKYQLENGWITKQEFEVIKDWHEALDKYSSPKNDDNDHLAILNDSKWLHILQIGQAMKSKLASIVNESEKKILIEEINYLNSQKD